MAISRQVIDKYLKNTPFHFQVEIININPPYTFPGRANIIVRVKKILRATTDIKEGDEISFYVNVYQDENVPIGDSYFQWEIIKSASYLEVFLQKTDTSWVLPFTDAARIISELNNNN